MYSSSFSIGDETFNGRDSSILLPFSSSKQDSSSGQKRLGRNREQFSSIFLHIRLRKHAVFRGKRDLGLEEEDGFILFGGFGAAKSSGRLIGVKISLLPFLAVTRYQSLRTRRDFCLLVVTTGTAKWRSYTWLHKYRQRDMLAGLMGPLNVIHNSNQPPTKNKVIIIIL